MKTLLLTILVLLCACQRTPQAPAGLRKSAYARPGIHHARITGRFVSTRDQKPVAGIYVQIRTGNEGIGSASAVSGSDGAFVFDDVSAPGPRTPMLHWGGGPEWAAGSEPLLAATGDATDIGVIEVSPKETHAWFVVEGLDPSMHLRLQYSPGDVLYAQPDKNELKLANIPRPGGEWILERRNAKGDVIDEYGAPAQHEMGNRAQAFALKLPRAGNGLEVTKLPPREAKPQPFVARGEVTLPDGSPLAGAVVAPLGYYQPPQQRTAFTDPQGRFQITFDSGQCVDVGFSAGGTGGSFPLRADYKSQQECFEAWNGYRKLQIGKASRIPIPDAWRTPQTRVSWLHEALGWIPFPGADRVWFLQSNDEPVVRIEVPGKMPAIAEQQDLQFGDPQDPAKRELLVTSEGKPLAGAIVDLEYIRDVTRDNRFNAGSYRTEANGRLQLQGASGRLVEIFVYHPGHDAARAIWEPGTPLHLDLRPRNSRLLLRNVSPGQMIRVSAIGDPQNTRTLHPSRQPWRRTAILNVARGDYDVIVYDDADLVLRAQSLHVQSSRKVVDTRRDGRPTSAPKGPAVYFTGGIAALNSDGTDLYEGGLRLRNRGSWQAGSRWFEGRTGGARLTMTFAEGESSKIIELRAGAPLEFAKPPADGRLQIDPPTPAARRWMFQQIMLVPDDRGGWTRVETIRRDETVTIENLPAGHYALYQHFTMDQKGKPIDAWGGLPVTIERGKTARVQRFADFPFGPLEVEVRDAAGALVHGATLRVRDPLVARWRGPVPIADFVPLPDPPADRIRNGRAKLPNIRRGPVDLVVEMNTGVIHWLRADANPGALLKLTIPQ